MTRQNKNNDVENSSSELPALLFSRIKLVGELELERVEIIGKGLTSEEARGNFDYVIDKITKLEEKKSDEKKWK